MRKWFNNMNKIVNWLGQDMKFEGSLSSAIAKHEITNFPGGYIYDDGLLLEALAWYCLFKYLSRGSKHTIYDLKSNNAVINPYMQWQALKVKAANSVKIKLNQDKGWRNFFYNSTFIPRG